MRARLSMVCTCDPEPFVDDNLALSDAARIRTWTMLHAQPGHEVTATIVATYDAGPDAPHPLTLMGAARNLQRLSGALFHLS